MSVLNKVHELTKKKSIIQKRIDTYSKTRTQLVNLIEEEKAEIVSCKTLSELEHIRGLTDNISDILAVMAIIDLKVRQLRYRRNNINSMLEELTSDWKTPHRR